LVLPIDQTSLPFWCETNASPCDAMIGGRSAASAAVAANRQTKTVIADRQVTDGSFYEMVAAKKPVDSPGGERTSCSTMVIFPRNSLVVLTAFALLCIGASAASAADGRRRGEAAPAAGGDAPSGWDMALTGGFVATGLVDPVYALGNVAGQPTRVVLRQPDQESTVNLGVAMFAQVYHDRYAWIAPLSFGIGVRGDSRATFYLGRRGRRTGRDRYQFPHESRDPHHKLVVHGRDVHLRESPIRRTLTFVPDLAEVHDHLDRFFHVLDGDPFQPRVEVLLAGEEVRRR
jgi:hypothetical protein